jgi:hypothetical protein
MRKVAASCNVAQTKGHTSFVHAAATASVTVFLLRLTHAGAVPVTHMAVSHPFASND